MEINLTYKHKEMYTMGAKNEFMQLGWIKIYWFCKIYLDYYAGPFQPGQSVHTFLTRISTVPFTNL